ncbi:hypothetical protein HWI79_1942 [Cryptosporidium felis]|nr:hypothetical protein HWI79_1942 [Cryptosporidium felis]
MNLPPNVVVLDLGDVELQNSVQNILGQLASRIFCQLMVLVVIIEALGHLVVEKGEVPANFNDQLGSAFSLVHPLLAQRAGKGVLESVYCRETFEQNRAWICPTKGGQRKGKVHQEDGCNAFVVKAVQSDGGVVFFKLERSQQIVLEAVVNRKVFGYQIKPLSEPVRVLVKNNTLQIRR